MKLLPVNNPDPTIVNKTFRRRHLERRLEQLPYPQKSAPASKNFAMK